MLVTFSSKASGDFTMFGDVALKLIRIMGHGGSIPGAIGADEVAIALERLRKAVQADKTLNAGKADDSDDEPGSERAVSLAQRAVPLIEMLEAAAEQNAPVMWSK